MISRRPLTVVISLLILSTAGCIIDWPSLKSETGPSDADADMDADMDADHDEVEDADNDADGESSDADVETFDCDGPCPRPTISLQANDDCVDVDESLELSWECTYATSCLASGPTGTSFEGARPPSGHETIEASATGRYELYCSGPGGTNLSAIEVMVEPEGPVSSEVLRANYGSRTVDGNLDDWGRVDAQLRQFWEGECDGDWDCAARFGASWDLEFLYFVVIVSDNSPGLAYDVEGRPLWSYEHDGVELMFNGLNNEPRYDELVPTRAILDFDDHKLNFSAHDIFAINERLEAFLVPIDGDITPDGADVYHEVSRTAENDYTLEVALRWRYLIPDIGFTPRPGTEHGLDLAVIDNDRDDPGDPDLRDAVLIWRLADYYFRDTRGWGTMVLTCD